MVSSFDNRPAVVLPPDARSGQHLPPKMTLPTPLSGYHSKSFSPVKTLKSMTDADVLLYRRNKIVKLVDHPGTRFLFFLLERYCQEFNNCTTTKVRKKEIVRIIVKTMHGRRFLCRNVNDPHAGWVPITDPRQRVRALLKRHNSGYSWLVGMNGQVKRIIVPSTTTTTNTQCASTNNEKTGKPPCLPKLNISPPSPSGNQRHSPSTTGNTDSHTTLSSPQSFGSERVPQPREENLATKYFASLAQLFDEEA